MRGRLPLLLLRFLVNVIMDSCLYVYMCFDIIGKITLMKLFKVSFCEILGMIIDYNWYIYIFYVF